MSDAVAAPVDGAGSDGSTEVSNDAPVTGGGEGGGGSEGGSGGGSLGDMAAQAVDAATSDGSPEGGEPKEPAEPKEPPKKIKGKVNGKEVEYTEEQLVRKAQLADAADEKFKEASQMKKDAVAIVEAIRSNPRAVLEQLGINFREVAETELGKDLEWETLPEGERELRELRDFKAQQEARQQEEAQTAEQRQQQEAFDAQTQQVAEQLDRDLTEALTNSKLPRSPMTVRTVTGLMLAAREKGYDLDAATAVDMAQEQTVSSINSITEQMDGAGIVQLLGKDIVNKIRRYDLDQLRAKREGTPADLADQGVDTEATAPARREKAPSHMSPDEWRASIRKKAGF